MVLEVKQEFSPYQAAGLPGSHSHLSRCYRQVWLLSAGVVLGKKCHRVFPCFREITKGRMSRHTLFFFDSALQHRVCYPSARYSPLECLISLNPDSVRSSRLEL